MDKEKKYSCNKDEASWKLVDDEVVIINFETTYYYSLNATGSYVWQLLENEASTLPEIISSVSTHFDVSEKDIQNDVTNLINELCEENLILEKE
jgi:hypothetical protein